MDFQLGMDCAEVHTDHQEALLTHHSQDAGFQEFVNELQATEMEGQKKKR